MPMNSMTINSWSADNDMSIDYDVYKEIMNRPLNMFQNGHSMIEKDIHSQSNQYYHPEFGKSGWKGYNNLQDSVQIDSDDNLDRIKGKDVTITINLKKLNKVNHQL